MSANQTQKGAEAEDILGSEVHVPAADRIIKEIRVDGGTGATTISYGHCRSCGESISSVTEWAVCSKGCILCKRKECVHDHEGTAYCRQHFESEVINKREYKVLQCIRGKVPKNKIKKAASMSGDQVEIALAELEQRGLMVVKDYLLFREYSATDKGISALKSGKFMDSDGDVVEMSLS